MQKWQLAAITYLQAFRAAGEHIGDSASKSHMGTLIGEGLYFLAFVYFGFRNVKTWSENPTTQGRGNCFGAFLGCGVGAGTGANAQTKRPGLTSFFVFLSAAANWAALGILGYGLVEDNSDYKNAGAVVASTSIALAGLASIVSGVATTNAPTATT